MSRRRQTGLRSVTTARRSLRRCAAAIVSLTLGCFVVATPLMGTAWAATTCDKGATLNIVAHQDDDLLFMSPDLLKDVKGGICVRTIYVTAGDANRGTDYWMTRENGPKAAYAKMAGVANTWIQSDAGIPGHPAPLFTLKGKPNITLVSMRLPDGGGDGSGGSLNNFESLQKLYEGAIPTMTALDRSSSYTSAGLVAALLSAMVSYQPTDVRTQDYVATFEDVDHSDHQATAYYAHLASQQYQTWHTFTGYLDYASMWEPQNVSGGQLTDKTNAFLAYAKYDPVVCQTASACSTTDYGKWLARQYTVGTESGPVSSTDIAPAAAVTASSENVAAGQQAIKAVDGVWDAWPADETKEWATIGGKGGSWLSLRWPTAQSIARVTLHDRANTGDQVTAGNLQFSDGTKLNFGALDNSGAGLTLDFPPKSTTSLRVNITAVSKTTKNVGLAEVYVYPFASTAANASPVANAGSDATATLNAQVQLDGSASYDPDGDPITYAWTQTAGPTVALSNPASAQPTFTAPSTATSLTFGLVVNDGQVNSSPDSVTITVSAPSSTTNIAPTATVTASSENVSTQQQAVKAVDGVWNAWPGDYTKEWATIGGKAGSWLNLQWSAPQTIGKVVLYDRANTDDQITGGNLTFSDGGKLAFGALDNGGAALTLTFPAKTTTSLRLDVTAVSSTTLNVGLAEIQVFPADASSPSNAAPVASAGADATVAAGSTVQLDGSGSYDPDGDVITYAWSQTGGTQVTLSSPSDVRPTFAAPATASTLTFSLVVNDGQLSSAPASVTVTVNTVNIAPTATVTASSENVSTQQQAVKAVDGVWDGWPYDYTKEWATIGGKAGSWLNLQWSSARTVSRVVLYDRANSDDQVTGGTLVFSDGSSVPVGPLANLGGAVTITFPAKTTTSIRLNITAVSATTQNIGLAEIEVW